MTSIEIGAEAPQSDAASGDFITILSASKKPDNIRIRLTKKILANGDVLGYEKAKTHTTSRRGVNDIEDVARVISAELEQYPYKAVIRGQFVGQANVLPENNTDKESGKLLKRGKYLRNDRNFPDVPHHWMMIDVDHYGKCTHDPVSEPELAAMEFIQNELPEVFHEVSFFWQLSSSAATRGNERILKVHLWFWLTGKMDSNSLRIWAEALNAKAGEKLVDPVVYQPVQLHYCAAPVLDDGVNDPVPERSGYWDSPWGLKEVSLVLTEDMQVAARNQRERPATAESLKDQSTKHGRVGLFYRTFTWEDVVYDILEGEFEEGSAEHRLTWSGSDSGAPDGAWIAGPCEHHIGANHNSWPGGANRVVSLFDCVRHLKFGHLDEGAEELDLLSMNSTPSYLAMCDWMDEQPAVQEQRLQEGQQRLDTHSDLIESESAPEESQPGQGLRTHSMAELMRLPGPTWLVKGLFARDSLALVYGQSSVGKTFAVVDMALAVARGTGEWFGRKAKSGMVLYIAGEGARGLVNRLKAYCQYHDIKPEAVAAQFYSGRLNLLEMSDVDLAEATACALRPKLIIIDTLATTMPGGDESSAQDMTQYLDAAKVLRRVSGACVLIVHHSGKDEARGARGSSALRAAVDTEIAISQNGDARVMRITKQRDGEAGFELAYHLEIVELGLDEDLEPITSCVVKQSSVPPPHVKQKKLGRNEEIVLRVMNELGGIENQVNQGDLLRVAAEKIGNDDKRGKDKARQALNSLIGKKMLVIDGQVVRVPF